MISGIIAKAIDETGYPVSSISVIAPLVGAAPLAVIEWSHFDTRNAEAGDGVTMREMERAAPSVIQLPPLADINSAVYEAAWAWGAWDISRVSIGPDYRGTLPPELSNVEALVRQYGYVTWSFRPMANGPAIRQKQKRPDVTLCSFTGGRTTPAPEIAQPPLKPDHQTVIKLGKTAAKPDDKPARDAKKWVPFATRVQIQYIIDLRRKAGLDPLSQVRLQYLTRKDASRMIDRLLDGMDDEQ